MYRRFSPSILSSLGEPGGSDFASRLEAVVENASTMGPKNWDTEVFSNSVSIPKGLALVMCDVDCGSETVGMVKQVLEWRKANHNTSKEIWDSLSTCIEALAHNLHSGIKQNIASSLSQIREKIREMGKLSGVPIEPPEQTELIDAVTAAVPGVIGGVVPGAGGYDAVVLLVQDDEVTITEVKAFLKKWTDEKKNGTVKLLDAKGELEGARVEDVSGYGTGFA